MVSQPIQAQFNISTMPLTWTCLTFKNMMAETLKVSEFRKKTIQGSNALVAYFKVFSKWLVIETSKAIPTISE